MLTPSKQSENPATKPTTMDGSFFGAGGSAPFFQAKLVGNKLKSNFNTGVSNLVQAKETTQPNIEEEIPDLHIIYEYIAHHIVYEKESFLKGGNSIETYNAIQKALWLAGFNPNPKESVWLGSDNPKEADACIIFPRNETYLSSKGTKQEIMPILAFRGSELDNFKTDLDWTQVGHNLYHKNEKRILEMLDLVERVDITGHSLGGALAQIATARNPGKVRKLVTFQSPGISKLEVQKFNNIPKEQRPEVFHHSVNNDLVDLAGEENIPGTFYRHHLANYLNPASAHTSFVFATDTFEKRRTKLYGMSDSFLTSMMGVNVYSGHPSISKYDKYPNQRKREIAETARKKAGEFGRDVKEFVYDLLNFIDFLAKWEPPGGINFVTPEGGAMPEKRKAKVDVDTIDIEILIEVFGALGKGAKSLIGKPSLGNEMADKINDLVEMYKKYRELTKGTPPQNNTKPSPSNQSQKSNLPKVNNNANKKSIPDKGTTEMPKNILIPKQNLPNNKNKSEDGVKDQYVYYDASNTYFKVVHFSGKVEYSVVNPYNGISKPMQPHDLPWRNVKDPDPGPTEIPIEETLQNLNEMVIVQKFKNGKVLFFRIINYFERVPITKEQARDLGKGEWNIP